MSHTKLPWYATETDVQSAAINEDNYVCKTDTREDAQFIVTACNCHAELIEALQDIVFPAQE